MLFIIYLFSAICFHTAGKKQPGLFPLDKTQVERFFNAAENVVFTSHRLHPQPPSSPPPHTTAPGIQDLALLRRLTISSPTKDCGGSPMSIENHIQDGGNSPFPKTNPSPPPTAAATATAATTTGTLPPPPRPELSEHEANLIFMQRSALDSEAMLTSCPPHLSQVNQTFLKQAEAVKLADQCNAGLPVVVEPELLLSKVSEVPRKPQVIGVAKPQPPLEINTTAAGGGNGDGIVQPVPPPPTSSGENNKTEAEAQGGVPEASTIEKPKEEAVPEIVHNFNFNYEEYCKPVKPAAGDGSEQKEQQPEEDSEEAKKENDRKRARSDESAAFMKQLQDNYAAALAQLNAPIDAKPPPPPGDPAATTTTAAHSNSTGGAGGVAQPTKSGDSATSSLGRLLAQSPIPRRTQEAIRVFCVEKLNERTGLFYRNFTATSYANVWRAYNTASRPNSLHWYEVVREGRPCHLYFDLEFARSSAQNWNTDVDGDALVDTLLNHVKAILLRNWELVLDLQTQVYELDSSTPEKFSRHVIVRIPGHAFFHNLAIGHFVSQVLAAAGTELDVLKNPAPSEERVSFVDTAVYTKNRHFRLVYSSKGGKTATLKPTRRYATGGQGLYKLSPARIFNDTLICNVDYDVKLLAVLPPFRNGVAPAVDGATGGGGGAASGRGGGGIHQGDVQGRTVAWKNNEHTEIDLPIDADANSGGCSEADFRRKLKTVAEKAVPFIEQIGKQRSGQEARARTVAFCGTDGLVAYSMIGPGSHYCEHVGRAHKNNHVYFVANFSEGVYAQKCHDPDCSRFRSAWMPLPEELCLEVKAEEKPQTEV